MRRLPGPGCMHPVEQRLNSLTYRFRRLSWREEAAITLAPGEDARDVILAHSCMT